MQIGNRMCISFLKQYAGSESTTTPCHRICYRTRGVSPRQAEILTALCTKLGAANRAEAVAIALRKLLLSI